jgi:Fe-S cluster biosynthesis and repair protein YggX
VVATLALTLRWGFVCYEYKRAAQGLSLRTYASILGKMVFVNLIVGRWKLWIAWA